MISDKDLQKCHTIFCGLQETVENNQLLIIIIIYHYVYNYNYNNNYFRELSFVSLAGLHDRGSSVPVFH